MKRSSFFSFIAFVITTISLFTSCNSDGSNETHLIQVMRPVGLAYADQESDSLSVLSTDSWKCTISSSWITPVEITQSQDKYMTATYPFYLSANTSGIPRLSNFTIKSNGKNVKTITKTYIQVAWLNIVRPEVVVTRSDSIITSIYDIDHLNELKGNFVINLPSSSVIDTIKLNLYAPTATVSTDLTWLSLRSGLETGKTVNISRSSSVNPVIIEMTADANTFAARRSGKITIKTSNGVTQCVSVYQNGTKK